MSESDLVRRLRETANAEERDGRRTLAAEIREAAAALEAAERGKLEAEAALHRLIMICEEGGRKGRPMDLIPADEWKRARAALAQRATEGQ